MSSLELHSGFSSDSHLCSECFDICLANTLSSEICMSIYSFSLRIDCFFLENSGSFDRDKFADYCSESDDGDGYCPK